MTIEDAARSLHEEVHLSPWFTAVGVGRHRDEPCIFLYVREPDRRVASAYADGWLGFPVQVRTLNRPRPVAVRA
jgi:hypothetical protein